MQQQRFCRRYAFCPGSPGKPIMSGSMQRLLRIICFSIIPHLLHILQLPRALLYQPGVHQVRRSFCFVPPARPMLPCAAVDSFARPGQQLFLKIPGRCGKPPFRGIQKPDRCKPVQPIDVHFSLGSSPIPVRARRTWQTLPSPACRLQSPCAWSSPCWS